MMQDYLMMVEKFHDEVLGTEIPDKPKMLSLNRVDAGYDHLNEELREFSNAKTVADQADAMVDLIYVAFGRLLEMGVVPGPVFEAVHNANMQKKKGVVDKRPRSEGQDATKPEGWKPADLETMLDYTLIDLLAYEKTSPLFLEATAVREKKGEDYNDGLEIKSYMPFGHKSYAQMVYLKAVRVISLVTLIEKGKVPNFDGLKDTLLDLVNYASFYSEAIDKDELKL